jgi:cytochrome P450
MLTPEDLDLAYLPMEEPGFSADPFPHMNAARQKHPWLARCAFGYTVISHDAIRDLLRLDNRLEPSFGDVVELMGAAETEWGRFQQSHILNLSGDAHKRLRGIVGPMFTTAEADRNRPLMRETMTRLLDEWAPRGAFDFEEFVSYFPISVISAMIGASLAEIPRLRSSLEALGLALGMNRDFMPEVEKGHRVMDEFVHQLVAARRAGQRPGDGQDLLDLLLAATRDHGLTDREVCDLLIFTFVAGYDTSKNVLTFIMKTLLDHPHYYARCADDLDFCGKVVEEALRFVSPATITRRVGQDVVYRDVRLPKGSLLFFPVNVSGRDPEAFEDADEFQPERERGNRHLAFGRGMHICLGQFIARAQIEEGLHLIAQRIRNPRLVGPVGHRTFFGVWGLRGLPIEFDPGR